MLCIPIYPFNKFFRGGDLDSHFSESLRAFYPSSCRYHVQGLDLNQAPVCCVPLSFIPCCLSLKSCISRLMESSDKGDVFLCSVPLTLLTPHAQNRQAASPRQACPGAHQFSNVLIGLLILADFSREPCVCQLSTARPVPIFPSRNLRICLLW